MWKKLNVDKKYQQINQQVTDSVRNLIMGHVWIFQPHNNPNKAQKRVTEHITKLLLVILVL